MLKNLDAINGLTALEQLVVSGCDGVTNLDGIKELKSLKEVAISGAGFTKEQTAELKASLPGAKIFGP